MLLSVEKFCLDVSLFLRMVGQTKKLHCAGKEETERFMMNLTQSFRGKLPKRAVQIMQQ